MQFENGRLCVCYFMSIAILQTMILKGNTAVLSCILALQWLLVTLSVLGKMFVAGALEVLYILSSELFPTVVRNVGMGTSSACARAGSMLSPYIAQLVSRLDTLLL